MQFLANVKRLPLAAAVALSLSCGMAAAAPAIQGFTGGTSFPSFNGSAMTIGWQFSVAAGAGVTVTDLGYYDPTPSTLLASNHDVGIWTMGGVLLGSATVLTNSALTGDFRYAAVTPFSLDGGVSQLPHRCRHCCWQF